MSASNSPLSAHYHVSLVDADATAGTYSAPFPGTKNVTSFTPTTNPNSHSYAGADTYVSVTGIGASQQAMTMQIAFSNRAIKQGVEHTKGHN
jgi:immune inhibitor A